MRNLTQDETCAECFAAAQALVIERPGFFAVHHLSVPSCMPKHAAFSHRGWLAARLINQRQAGEGALRAKGSRRWSSCRGANRRPEVVGRV